LGVKSFIIVKEGDIPQKRVGGEFFMLKPADIARVKARGFLLNRGTERFSGRVVSYGGVFTAEQMEIIAQCARLYGNGKIIMTTRLAVELVGIPYEKIDEAIEYVESRDPALRFGGTGAKVRPVIACKGTTCVYGNFDTQALGKKIHDAYYLGWTDVKLPHKFKIAVGGCPNSCAKPSLNDFGIEGHRVPEIRLDKCRGCKVCQVAANCPVKAASLRDGKVSIDKSVCKDCGVCLMKCPFGVMNREVKTVYRIFVGGTWGKKTRMATALPEYVTEEEILPILEKTMLWFKKNAYQKERLGAAIDRVGEEQFLRDIAGDDLLRHKEEILAAEVKARP